MKKIRVGIADDNKEFCEILTDYFSDKENIDIVFEETEDEVLKRLKNKKEKENSLADFLNGLK